MKPPKLTKSCKKDLPIWKIYSKLNNSFKLCTQKKNNFWKKFKIPKLSPRFEWLWIWSKYFFPSLRKQLIRYSLFLKKKPGLFRPRQTRRSIFHFQAHLQNFRVQIRIKQFIVAVHASRSETHLPLIRKRHHFTGSPVNYAPCKISISVLRGPRLRVVQ